jgi:L-aspartate oxidase
LKVYHTDFLVLGSGIAGLSFALKVAPLGKVTLMTKKEDSESNTNYAQGGIASVIDPEDSIDSHYQDTIKTGCGLSHPGAVRVLVTEGPDRLKELVEWGVRFSYERSRDGKWVLSLGREGGHSRRRIVRADDLTGHEIERALLACLMKQSDFELFENHFVSDLLVGNDARGRRCVGAMVYNRLRDEFEAWYSPVTFLATGGSGQVYPHTTNPEIATGDGIAMAYRAGARIADMEFIQFHPTALYPAEGKAFLISEAVRGEGAVLLDGEGKPFMKKYHPQGDLAPRDIVARAIDRELKISGRKHLYLDLSPIEPDVIIKRFPNITRGCLQRGINIMKEPIPVVTAAHYMCGGVLTDIWGMTSIRGLFAVGEVACTGVHGSNRLASNSLLEAVVFSHRAAVKAKEVIDGGRVVGEVSIENPMREGKGRLEAVIIRHLRDQIRTIMWDCVGIMRSMERLEMAGRELSLILAEIEEYRRASRFSVDIEELRNMGQVADLIVKSAIARRESRGLHYNLDFPEQNDEDFLRDTVFYRENGGSRLELIDVMESHQV